MADRAISDLNPATSIGEADLFVTQQGSQAKKVTGQIFVRDLATMLDGHGGIKTIAKTGTSVLEDTYTITMSDDTTATFTVTNGRSITGITWQTSGTPGDGQIHTGTIAYNDGTTSTITIEDGVKGDTGDAWNVFIRYSSEEPTSDADVYTTPDDWMGVYAGIETNPSNLHYTDYSWYQIKGAKGDTGEDCAITSQVVEYQASASGTVVPTGTWTTTIPTVTKGEYLWTRITLNFTDGTSTTAYAVGYYGLDGSGAGDMQRADYDASGTVRTAGGIPTYVDERIGIAEGVLISGKDTLSGYSTSDQYLVYDPSTGTNYKQSRQALLSPVETRIDAVETQIDALETYEPLRIDIASFNTLPQTVNNAAITEDMVVLGSWFSRASSQTEDWTVTTSNGSLTVSGTIRGWTALTLILGKANA